MEINTALAIGIGIGIGVLATLAAVFLPQFLPQAPHEIRAHPCASDPSESEITLPPPSHSGLSVEEAISSRRSVRSYSDSGITLSELSQLLWAAQGITGEGGLRSAPSAGALYPIDIYIYPNRVEGASCGIYRYVPDGHRLVLAREGDFSDALCQASFGQRPVCDAAAVFIFAAKRGRVAQKYGESSDAFIAMEAGHISQNVLLESVSLGLGAVPVGAFSRESVDRLLGINGGGESSIYINCVGRP
ncbi:MAG TPA: SagB/ThcOx family dehydrogenase [Candidatus Bilamarchaeaceae archaeon]|nr:SagB/ThcOx family dehydrogenase [Candidatus Bilamarchaeaceae archaeon]